MDLFHQTWFWVVIIVGPIGAVVGILARLAKREPPPDLPPTVKPLGFDDEDEDDDWGAGRKYHATPPPKRQSGSEPSRH